MFSLLEVLYNSDKNVIDEVFFNAYIINKASLFMYYTCYLPCRLGELIRKDYNHYFVFINASGVFGDNHQFAIQEFKANN